MQVFEIKGDNWMRLDRVGREYGGHPLRQNSKEPCRRNSAGLFVCAADLRFVCNGLQADTRRAHDLLIVCPPE
jgi:hypothetical protein